MIIKGLISIIVPVYNCAAFLPQCIDSILIQSYKRIEIILVDDGATDGSGKICEEYSRRDSRVRVFHKENSGQMASRLFGIRHAKGEYIGFVDADDWIDFGMYEHLFNEITNSDLATCGLYRYDNKGKIIASWIDLLPEGVYSSSDEMRFIFQNLIIANNYDAGVVIGGITNNCVTKLFRKDIINQILDNADVKIRKAEDFFFNLLYILKCKSIKITHKCLYNYRDNISSVCHKNFPNYLSERELFDKKIRKAFMGHKYEDIFLEQWRRRFLYETFLGLLSNYSGNEILFPTYFPPFIKRLYKKNIVLFGNGKVGKSYSKWFSLLNICNIVVIIDNNPKENAMPVTALKKIQFDLIIIGVLNEETAENISLQLEKLNIQKELILWEKPVNVFNKFFF